MVIGNKGMTSDVGKKKLVHLTCVDWRAVSGANQMLRRVLTSADCLEGYTQEVLSLKLPAQRFAEGLDRPRIRCREGRHVNGLELPKYPTCLRRWRSWGALRAARPNVVLTWSWKSGRVLITERRSAIAGCPALLREAGDMWSSGRNHPDSYRRVLHAHQRIVCNSQAAKECLVNDWGVSPEKVAVVPNPLPSAFLVEGEPKPRRQDDLVIGVAGRFVDIKGIPLAIHAVKLLRRRGVAARLEIAGSGHREHALRGLVQREGLEECCHFWGRLEDMRAFYDVLDLLLVPSVFESFGLVSTEAQARGCPVVAAAVGGLPDTLEEGRSGYLVEPTLPLSAYERFSGHSWGGGQKGLGRLASNAGDFKLVDPEALAEAAWRIVQDPYTHQSFRDHSVAYVRAHFQMSTYCRRMCGLLEELF